MKTNILFRKSFVWALLLCLSAVAYAQDPVPADEPFKKKFDPDKAVIFSPSYTAQFPFGDMATRFGFNNLFGFHIIYKMKHNWLFGGEGNLLFGTKVKETYILDSIATSTGHLINQDNNLMTIRGEEIGFSVKISGGKIFPLSKKYPDAGIMIMTSAGFIQHKIGFSAKQNSVPQISLTYRKGYDRLCSGPVISQFIGGIFMGRKQSINVYGGLQFDLGFTQNRRPYDFYLERKLTEQRLDMFLGIKIGWIIPVFLQSVEKEYNYY